MKEISAQLVLYKELTQQRRRELTDVYKAFSTFVEPQEEDWSASFRVNKAHEIIEKTLPRIVAKNPKWLVSVKSEGAFPDELKEEADQYALFIQDYLTYIWDEYDLIEPARLWAKNMLVYGKGYAKVKYKYEIARVKTQSVTEVANELGELELDEDGEVRTEFQEKITEEVIGEYPTIDVKSWTNVYYDPRFVLMDDRPSFIEETEGVRLGDLMRKGDFINLDKVEAIGNIKDDIKGEDYKRSVLQIAGISDSKTKIDTRINTETLTTKTFYGLFNTGSKAVDERLYKITTVNDVVVILFEEITQNPFEEIKCFEDPETAFARGFVEPIMGLQDELNFKKNAASEYINKSLTRQVLFSHNSGIDPSTINDPVIVTSTSAEEAQRNFIELAKPEINPSYFQEQNDIERQIQAASFSIDTANPKSQQALTNTATGIRVKFFENNSVIDEARKHFERGLQSLAYKLLLSAFENIEGNIAIKKQGTEGYWKANKEALRDAVQRYSIRVEVNSSAFDSIENRREERLALFNTLLQAQAQGVNVNMEAATKDLLETFETLDTARYLNPPDIQQVAQQASGRPIPAETAARSGLPSPQELTKQVSRGSLPLTQ